MPLGLLGLIPALASGVGKILSDRKGNQVKDKSTTSQESTGSRTDTSGYGAEGQSLISMLLPLIQQFTRQGPSVDPSSVDRFANSQAMATNARAGALSDMLQGNAASSGLTYSAPSAFSRGVSEGFRGGALNEIEANAFNQKNNILRDNVAETGNRFNLAQGLLRMLPQVNNSTTSGTVTGNQQGTTSQQNGGLLGNIIQSGADIFTGMRNAGYFGGKDVITSPTTPVGTPPFNPNGNTIPSTSLVPPGKKLLPGVN